MTHYCFFNTFPRLLNYAYERFADVALDRFHSAFAEQPYDVLLTLNNEHATKRQLRVADRVATNANSCILLLNSSDDGELARVKNSFHQIMNLPADEGRRQTALLSFAGETKRKYDGFYLFFDTHEVPFERMAFDCTVTYRHGDGDDIADMVFTAQRVSVARFTESAPQQIDDSGANATLYIHASLYRQQNDDARFLFVCLHSIAVQLKPFRA
jgi:hypothetical protein